MTTATLAILATATGMTAVAIGYGRNSALTMAPGVLATLRGIVTLGRSHSHDRPGVLHQ